MSRIDEVRYCQRCGHAMELRQAFGVIRPVCPACGFVHFLDPKVAAAVLVVEEDRVLLVRRVMEPERGKWSLPAGFIEGDEDPRLAAARECLEETGLIIEITDLVDVLHSSGNPHGASILLVYQGKIAGGTLQAQDDADIAAWFGPDELPPLAFPSTPLILDRWLKGTLMPVEHRR